MGDSAGTFCGVGRPDSSRIHDGSGRLRCVNRGSCRQAKAFSRGSGLQGLRRQGAEICLRVSGVPGRVGRLCDRLLTEYKEDADSLRFYFLYEIALRRTEHHGVAKPVDLTEPLIL